MISELSKQQRKVLLLLVIAILLGSGNLLYQSLQRGPVEVYLVSPVSVPWPGKEPDLGFNQNNPLQLGNVQKIKTEPAEAPNNKEEPVNTGLSKKQPSGLIDPNTATSEELQTIPGIGPVLASRIVEYREQVKKFQKVEDLLEIKGIGKKTLEKIREYIEIKP